MKKIIATVVLAAAMMASVTACGTETKILHCDNCGAEIKVPADNKADDSWILYCEKCNKELGIDEQIMDILSD